MKQTLLLCTGLCLLTLGGGSSMAAENPEPVWLVDPAKPGENLPGSGRSQFDLLFAAARRGRVDYALPYPFAALLARIDSQLEPDSASALPPAKRVLIPLGRSLQRHAAAPDYFAFPRVVVAADSPPASPAAPLLKDRLYIAYQEKSALLEVISYNEAAGRFEFQLVKDYRADARPRVVYANRTLCFACHQNGGPIFSRPLWDETNANPQIAAQLAAQQAAAGRRFHGIRLDRGVDVPYAIDRSTRRANGLALTQRLWREGCGDADPDARRCRAGMFAAALRHALGGGRQAERSAAFVAQVDARVRSEAARRWPGGLAIAAPDIPNRNPLQDLPTASDDIPRQAAYAHVAQRFDPLLARPAQTPWRADASDAIEQLVGGLAELIVGSDLRRVDAALAARPAPRLAQRAPCRFDRRATRWSVRCQPAPGQSGAQLSTTLERRRGKVAGGRLESLTLPGAGTVNSVVLSASAPRSGETFALRPATRLRTADGNPLTRLAFRVSPDDPAVGEVRVERRQEFPAVDQAVADLLDGPDGAALFGAQPVPRQALLAALLAQLGAPGVAPCCAAAERLPAPALDLPAARPGSPATTADPAVQGFYPYCASCHQSGESFPPNFLSGSQIVARLRHCAPRLYVRLAMADLPPEQRDKTPMPPESLLPAFGTDRAEWRESSVRAALLAQLGEWLRSESGQAPTLDHLLAGGYEALRPCLPTP